MRRVCSVLLAVWMLICTLPAASALESDMDFQKHPISFGFGTPLCWSMTDCTICTERAQPRKKATAAMSVPI